MNEFLIMEDFPKSEIEFDHRFMDESACYDYLFKMKWPHVESLFIIRYIPPKLPD